MNTYFKNLNQGLKNYKRAIPCLLIDLDRLDKNIATLQNNLNKDIHFRIVVKSLPSFELIDYIMQKTRTKKIMVFHQPFLTDLVGHLDQEVDILLGKPMPIKTVTYFYNNLPALTQKFNPYLQIQWLVDTEKRIEEYIEFAKRLGQKLRLNLEIDVGLHRGGFTDVRALKSALSLIDQNKDHVTFSGLMGYDPHVVKLPSIVRSKDKALKLANDFYKACKDLIRKDFPELWSTNLTFNGAGSPTLNLHQTNSPLNDISAGSCLVKPISFDIPTLDGYQEAAFIATPVLKSFTNTTLPALEKISGMLNLINSTNQKSYFIYGGFWKANYCYPEGIKQNTLFGASTNQTMLNAPKSTKLEVDDFVFLRPHQSEFVFLQFGNILAIRNGVVAAEWSVLKNY